MLQQRGYYTINLGDGKQIPLRFCTWTFKRFCEVNGNMTLTQLQDALSSGMTLSGFVSLLLCAAEYTCLKDKKDFTYTDMDAADWIDEMGGVAGEGFVAMLKVIVETFTDGSTNGQEKKIPVSQKS
jgi:hypothetical protein